MPDVVLLNPEHATTEPTSTTMSSHVRRLEWNLKIAETPVLLIVEGPYRWKDSALVHRGSGGQPQKFIVTGSEDGTWTLIEDATASVADVADKMPVVLEQILKSGPTRFRHELTAEFTQSGSPTPVFESGTLFGIQQQLSDRAGSEPATREEWLWRATLRFESQRPIESSIRPARVAVFGSVLKALLQHWRKPA